MGGIMQQTQNLGQVDSRGGFSPYKHFRAKGSLFALKSFEKFYQMTIAHVRFKINNTPAQAYMNHQGGAKSMGLCNQAQELWKWCLLHQTIFSAEHLPGIHNRDADQASRIFNDRTEWMITSHLLREALSLLAVNPSIDLFDCSSEQTVSNLLQLETRSRRIEDRCLQCPMDTERPLFFPTILLGGKSSNKSHTRQVSEPSSCDTLVAFSTMVSPSAKFSHHTATIPEGNKHFRAKGSLFALKSFEKFYQMTIAHVRFKINNTPAQAYMNHQGGAKSMGLCNQAQELWKWCLLHQTIFSAEHLPGIHNRDADQASRIFNDRTEWMITSHLLREALSLLAVNPSIDLFDCSSEQTVSNLLQLETISRCIEDRCLQCPMDTERPLFFPTILLGGKSSNKSHTRQVSEPSSCDTLVAFSTMVSPSAKFSHHTATIPEGNKTTRSS